MTRHHVQRSHGQRLAVALIAAVVLLVSGCGVQFVRPQGDAPLRYRDVVFESSTMMSGIRYGRADDQDGMTVDLELDIYRPDGDAVNRRPAVIWVHGGGFSGGTRTSPEIVDQARTFARKGFVTASISYRLADRGCSASGVTQSCLTAIKDAQHDAQAAVRFLRSRATDYRIDPNRIAVAGTSAGAITALNVGYAADDDAGSSGTPGVSSEIGAAVSLSGSRLLTSPSAGDAPALLFHGTADRIVPFQWAQDTIREAMNAGLIATLTRFEGDGHVPYVEHRQEILDQTTNFLYATLDLEDAAA